MIKKASTKEVGKNGKDGNMKRLSEYINEGIFGDNVKSAIKINGVEIYEPEWKLCEEYYQKRRKKYFHTDKVLLGDMEDEYEVVYNGDDCIIAVSTEEFDQESGCVYILSPETIYMCHEAAEICDGRHYVFSLTNVNEANDFDICFGWDPQIGWLSICPGRNSEQKLKEVGFVNTRGYIPETISSKAQNIIKKYMKH